MVIYHAINYSVFRPWAFRFLGFLPLSFILITGFLVGQIYAAKLNIVGAKVYLRLATRGLKLLLLCTALNVANFIATEGNVYDGLWEFGARAQEFYLTGNGRIGIFEILIPIGYFLLIAPGLVWLNSRTRVASPVLTVIIVILCIALERQGVTYKNLSLFSIGMLGMTFGSIPMKSVDWLARKWLFVAAIYGIYRLLTYFLGDSYPIQSFGATISVLLLYSCALKSSTDTLIGRQMVTFGKYSLVGYIAQIAILRLLVKVFGGKPETIFGVCLLAAGALLITFLLVLVLDKVRQKSRPTDFLYKSVFA